MKQPISELIEEGGYIERADITQADFSDFLGEELRVLDSQFTGCTFSNTVFSRSHFSDVTFTEMSAPDVSFVHSGLHNVVFSHSRIGGFQAFDSSWVHARIEACKIGFFNLRGTRITDIHFVDCTLDELDLSAAQLKNVIFDNCTIDHLVMNETHCTKVDVRGAHIARVSNAAGLKGTIMNPEQFTELAPSFAKMLGITLK
ncbi:pentapeptide repeat-containing protein [Timonella sp. A28]|uniref:pentapeptide repeat-containing protein n=1 Tax=Timonella sp. A28 TaxID=3442640 RepID=UPI003EBF2505